MGSWDGELISAKFFQPSFCKLFTSHRKYSILLSKRFVHYYDVFNSKYNIFIIVISVGYWILCTKNYDYNLYNISFLFVTAHILAD